MADYDTRARNYYEHQGASLKSRDKMIKERGVKPGTPNLPRMDATHQGMAKRLREGDAQRNSMGSNSSGVSDKDARAAGFRNAAEMQAFYANRARMRARGGSAGGTKGKEAPPPTDKKKDGSLLGRLLGPVNRALGN